MKIFLSFRQWPTLPQYRVHPVFSRSKQSSWLWWSITILGLVKGSQSWIPTLPISVKIVRWVRVGNNLETGSHLGDLIGVCIFDLCSNSLKAPIIFSNVWNIPYPQSFLWGNPSPSSNYVPQLWVYLWSAFSCYFLVCIFLCKCLY